MYPGDDLKMGLDVVITNEAHKPWHLQKDWSTPLLLILLVALMILFICTVVFCPQAMSQARIPGVDASDKMEAAGTVLRLIDTALFKWGARIFAGICVMSSAWSLKEQRFGIAIICIVGAIIFGTAPHWVKNIFEISGNDSVFGLIAAPGGGVARLAMVSWNKEGGSCTTTPL